MHLIVVVAAIGLAFSGDDAVSTQRIRQFAQSQPQSDPGCVVGIMAGGRTVDVISFGSASLELKTPIVPGSAFNIGSVAKQFTALAALLLVNDGRLKLDDDVRLHLPQLPKYPRVITVRDLLQHTTGLRDVYELLKMAGWRTYHDRITNDDLMSIIKRQAATNFPAGHETGYSNTNYFLLARVIESASGIPFAEFMKQRIFTPLGMQDTRIRQSADEVIPNRVTAYIRSGRNQPFVLGMTNDETDGAGNLFTTALDMSRWEQNFVTATVGSPAILSSMWSPATLRDGRKTPVGFGFNVSEAQGTLSAWHGGAESGYHSYYVRYPADNQAVFVLCNRRDRAGTSPRELAEMAVEDLRGSRTADRSDKPAQLPKATPLSAPPSFYAGRYYNAQTGAVVVIAENAGGLAFTDFGSEDITPLIHVSGHQFASDDGKRYIFRTEGDRVAGVVQENGTADESFQSVQAPRIDQKTLVGFAGEYVSEDAAATWRVAVVGHDLVLSLPKAAPETLIPAFKDGFYAEQWTIVFARDASGRVSGLTATNERARNVLFHTVAPKRSR